MGQGPAGSRAVHQEHLQPVVSALLCKGCFFQVPGWGNKGQFWSHTPAPWVCIAFLHVPLVFLSMA